jgi:hypothetical protein
MSEELIEELGTFAYDPVGFVYWAFPWGERGELSDEEGPDLWQLWVLQQVKDRILTVEEAIQLAVTSGHGVGKSALVSWLIWWAFSTFPGTRGVVTANTENQLKTKTWVEIAKWHRLFIAKHVFKCTATALFTVDEDMAREWRIDIVPWSERNTEAFAGLHNAGKRIIIVFDEGSAIPDVIWEVTEGATTDENTEIMWFVFGNPTRQTGRFRECFGDGKFAHRWINKEVDSREVKRTNKDQLNRWIEDYGEDSDFCRVRIFGKFPRTDENSFITRDSATAAVGRVIAEQNVPWVLGVDVARFGDDYSVIYPRKGRDAFSEPPRLYQGIDTMQLASRVMEVYYELDASAIFVDGGGVGGGVIDRLASMGLPVIEVQFGGKPDGVNMRDPNVSYANKRAEIWGAMRDFLRTGAIPDVIPRTDISLVRELITPTYSFNNQQKIVLEPKDAMKRRGERSPDVADALATTFAYPIPEVNKTEMFESKPEDYNPFSEERIYHGT